MQNSMSYQFQFLMVMLAVFFWILDWIPIVNIFSNAVYWAIWLLIFAFKYYPLLTEIVKTGLSIAGIGTKIAIIASVAFILGLIPIVSIFPWNVISNWWINKLIKELLTQVEKIKNQASAVQGAWRRHQQQFGLRGGSAGRIQPNTDAPPRRPPQTAPNISEQRMAKKFGDDYIDENFRKRGERGFKDPNASASVQSPSLRKAA